MAEDEPRGNYQLYVERAPGAPAELIGTYATPVDARHAARTNFPESARFTIVELDTGRIVLTFSLQDEPES